MLPPTWSNSQSVRPQSSAPLNTTGAAPVDGPVAAEQRLAGVHERASRVAEREPAQRDEPDGLFLRAVELDQVAQTHDLDGGVV